MLISNPWHNVRAPLLLLTVGMLLGGCKVDITVPQGGIVESESGTYQCRPDSGCLIEVGDSNFDETFFAIPQDGWVFTGWARDRRHFCGGSIEPCRLTTKGFPGTDLESFLKKDETFFLQATFAREGEFVVTVNVSKRGGHIIANDGGGWRCNAGQTCRFAPGDNWSGALIAKPAKQKGFEWYRFAGTLPGLLEADPKQPWIYLNTAKNKRSEFADDQALTLTAKFWGPGTVHWETTFPNNADFVAATFASHIPQCEGYLPWANHADLAAYDLNSDGLEDLWLNIRCGPYNTAPENPEHGASQQSYLITFLQSPDGSFRSGNQELFGESVIALSELAGPQRISSINDLNLDGRPDLLIWEDRDASYCDDAYPQHECKLAWEAAFPEEASYPTIDEGRWRSNTYLFLSEPDSGYRKLQLGEERGHTGNAYLLAQKSDGAWVFYQQPEDSSEKPISYILRDNELHQIPTEELYVQGDDGGYLNKAQHSHITRSEAFDPNPNQGLLARILVGYDNRMQMMKAISFREDVRPNQAPIDGWRNTCTKNDAECSGFFKTGELVENKNLKYFAYTTEATMPLSVDPASPNLPDNVYRGISLYGYHLFTPQNESNYTVQISPNGKILLVSLWSGLLLDPAVPLNTADRTSFPRNRYQLCNAPESYMNQYLLYDPKLDQRDCNLMLSSMPVVLEQNSNGDFVAVPPQENPFYDADWPRPWLNRISDIETFLMPAGNTRFRDLNGDGFVDFGFQAPFTDRDFGFRYPALCPGGDRTVPRDQWAGTRECTPLRLFLNDRHGKLVAVPAEHIDRKGFPPVIPGAIEFSDLNKDGLMDIVVFQLRDTPLQKWPNSPEYSLEVFYGRPIQE